jgi:hypothetical protein
LARRCLTVFLLMLLAGLVPVACADPPDPSWIGGLWDDDDFDTVVSYIASAFAVFAQSDVDSKPRLVLIATARPASPVFARSAVQNTSRPRAPPTA